MRLSLAGPVTWEGLNISKSPVDEDGVLHPRRSPAGAGSGLRWAARRRPDAPAEDTPAFGGSGAGHRLPADGVAGRQRGAGRTRHVAGTLGLAMWRCWPTWLDWTVSFALIASAFAMVYKWVRRVRLAWRNVRIVATLTAMLFIVGMSLIGLYIGCSGVASPFGAAASLVVLLLWVYFSAPIFLLGAELTWVHAQRYGSLRSRSLPLAPTAPSRPSPVQR